VNLDEQAGKIYGLFGRFYEGTLDSQVAHAVNDIRDLLTVQVIRKDRGVRWNYDIVEFDTLVIKRPAICT